MVNELVVWMWGQRVGVLSKEQGRMSFCYESTWLARDIACALSQSMPLQSAPFSDESCLAFFGGLLPESDQRRLVANALQVSSRNDFALLAGIGGECAGALTLLPPGETPHPNSREVQWLSFDDIVNLLQEISVRPMLAGRSDLRLSLAGAQQKLPVCVDGDRIGLPLHGAASTHIVKLPIKGFSQSVFNEGFCLSLARACGLPCAQSRVVKTDRYEFLLVERYDRVIDGDVITRLHQEDFCQALGVVSQMKYQNEGGPDLQRCFALVRAACSPSAVHILRLLDAVIFNALVGNHDAHAKNFSLLYRDGKAQLAPLYDVVCTAVYEQLSRKMAMKLGNQYEFDHVFARHIDEFAQEMGLSAAQTRKRVIELAAQLPALADELHKNEFAHCQVVDDIVTVIKKRSELITQRLLAK